MEKILFIKVGEKLEIELDKWEDFLNYISSINHEIEFDDKEKTIDFLYKNNYVFLKLIKHSENKFYFKFLEAYR